MKKILIDCRFWGPKHTGLGRYAQNLVENLLKLSKKYHFYLLFSKLDFKVAPIGKDKNITPVFSQSRHYSVKEQLEIPLILLKIRPDLIHFPHFNTPVLSRYKTIITIHDLIKHYSKGLETTTRDPWSYLLKYAGYKLVFKNSVQKARQIIVPSEFVKKDLLKVYKLSGDKVKVVYEGVEKQFLKFKKPEVEKNSQAIKFLKSLYITEPYLVYIGNAYPHKNLERLIFAVKKINISQKQKNQNPVNLVIVSGRDVFWERLKNEVERQEANNFIKLPGYLSDNKLSLLLRHALAFVNPSTMEGFGLPGVEAMACYCPVICSNIPVFKEVYQNAALFFNPENVDSIKNRIFKLINFTPSQRLRLIKRGKKQADKYSWEKCAQKTLNTYESCFSL
jgi:glycosyltransferase involved in cell wall biosynthesis